MNQRKQAVMDYLFKGGGFALGDVKIVNVIAKKLQIVPGSFDIDSILIENNKIAFLPKTVSWIPGNIFIDNSILRNYFFGTNGTVGYEQAEKYWKKIFNLQKKKNSKPKTMDLALLVKSILMECLCLY